MKKLLTLAASIETATGLALMVGPSLVGRLLLGVELTGVSIPVARVAGIGLFSLGIACWPFADKAGNPAGALRAMLIYNVLATLYLSYLGIRGEWVGLLLWPAIVVHGALTFLLARLWFNLQADKVT